MSSMRLWRQQGAARLQLLAAVLFAAMQAATTLSAEAQAASGVQPADLRGNAERGEELFGQFGCIGCHTVNGIGGQVGPDLSRVARLDLAKDRPGKSWPSLPAYVRESLEDPQKYIVPNFPKPSPMPAARQFELTKQDIADLIAYLFDVAKRAASK